MATIEKRSATSYRATVSCGYDSNGKQIRKKKTITLPDGLTERQQQKEVQRQAVLFEEEVQSGTYLDGDKITFEDFTKRWLAKYAEVHLAPKTLERYKALLIRINQALGGIKLCKLRPNHIDDFMNDLAKTGIRDDNLYTMNKKYISYFKENKKELSSAKLDKQTISGLLNGSLTNKKTACKVADTVNVDLSILFTQQNVADTLSPQTRLHYYRLLNAILNKAVKWEMLLRNPAEGATSPRVERKEKQSLNNEEVKQMLGLLESAALKYQAAVYVAVFGGLRLGEIVALKWTDINLVSGKLSITKARQYIVGAGEFDKSPKNNSSKRELMLPEIALSKLEELGKEQRVHRFKLGSQWVDGNNIFTRWDGTPISPGTISHWFTDWITKTELPQITFHGLRHSSASLLIAYGTDIATVSKRLGHSRISTTVDIYTHAISKMDEKAANTFDSMFAPVALSAAN